MSKRILLAAAVAAGLSSPALSADLKGRWSLSLSGGTDIELSGDVHTAGRGTVLGLPTAVEARSFSDIYDPGFRGRLGVGYGIAPSAELFVRGSYYRMSSEPTLVGNVASLDLFGEWSDYKEWGGEVGIRYFFGKGGTARPYVAPSFGFRSVSEIPATFTVPAATVRLADVPYWDKSTLFQVGADVGVVLELSESFGLGIETGLRWQSQPAGLNGLAGTGLDSINDTGSRLSLPLLANLRFSF